MEATYTRNKTYVETKPAKAPEETADLEREAKKLEPAVEATYTRNKTYVETKPAKAPEELFETDASEREDPTQEENGQFTQAMRPSL